MTYLGVNSRQLSLVKLLYRCVMAHTVQTKASQLASKDLHGRRQEFLFAVTETKIDIVGIKGLLNDKRDAPAADLVCNICCTTLPAAILLHVLYVNSHAIGLAYFLLNYAVFLQRFLLTLHCTEHRKLFRPGCSWLNLIAPYVLSPLYGVPPGAYRLHHVVMHHVEDNQQGWDLSATEGFQRDNLLSFLGYWLRFFAISGLELPLYAIRRGRHREAATAASSMAAGWVLTVLLWRRCAVATFYTLLLPYAVSSLALMFGNWSQHIFVDPSNPRDDFTLTYNCIACSDNAKTYNDGYHVLHHANSRLHWSELPTTFIQQLQLHDDRDALVFQGIGVFDVGVAVFTKRLGWLAEHIVPCGPRQVKRSKQEWIELMQLRLQPVTTSNSCGNSSKVSEVEQSQGCGSMGGM